MFTVFIASKIMTKEVRKFNQTPACRSSFFLFMRHLIYSFQNFHLFRAFLPLPSSGRLKGLRQFYTRADDAFRVRSSETKKIIIFDIIKIIEASRMLRNQLLFHDVIWLLHCLQTFVFCGQTIIHVLHDDIYWFMS